MVRGFSKLILLLLLCAAASCGERGVNPSSIRDASRAPGSIVAVEHVSGYSMLKLRAMLWWVELPEPVHVSDGIELFRVRYRTTLRGRAVVASGLLGVPRAALRGASTRGWVMYLHGTSPYRGDSPSAPGNAEGVLPAAVFAGGGYLFLAPDYIGLGTSTGIVHPYLVAAATSDAAIDLVLAGQRVAAAMGVASTRDLFLAGFSQGGHAVAVVQRELERRPRTQIRLRAAAAIAGVFDLSGAAIPYALTNKHSMYLGFVGSAYAAYYRRPLRTLFREPYASALPKVFDGDHTLDQIEPALPADPKDLFQPEMLKEIEAKQPNWFTSALIANQAYDWVPATPLRLYYGTADKDASPADAIAFQRLAARRGGHVALAPLGPLEHSPSAYHGVPRARAWFDALTARPDRS